MTFSAFCAVAPSDTVLSNEINGCGDTVFSAFSLCLTESYDFIGLDQWGCALGGVWEMKASQIGRSTPMSHTPASFVYLIFL